MAVDTLRNCARRSRMQRWSRASRRGRRLHPARPSRAGGPACAASGNRGRFAVAAKPARTADVVTPAADSAASLGSPEAAQAAMGVTSGCRSECSADTGACAATLRPQRRVHFSEEPNQVIEVTPYREIYGMHPHLFVFDKNYYMVPAGGPYGFVDLRAAAEVEKSLDVEDVTSSESDGEDSDDGEWEPPILLHFC